MYDDGEEIYLILFVDNLLICGKNKKNLNYIKSLLMKRFQIKDMGEIKVYLGINIEYDYKKNVMNTPP